MLRVQPNGRGVNVNDVGGGYYVFHVDVGDVGGTTRGGFILLSVVQGSSGLGDEDFFGFGGDGCDLRYLLKIKSMFFIVKLSMESCVRRAAQN